MSFSDEDVVTVLRAFQASGFGRLVYETEDAAFTLRRDTDATAPAKAAPLSAESEPLVVTAHKLGILRRKAGEGNAISKDEVIAELEVLGICHPVAAPRCGRLRQWAAEDGSLVEWGAPIATLEFD